ncbi:intron endonuclease [Aspergillus ruber CBS 135680]|uniref:Intron endonuclease n=1 Tax=Aspergillus ruber (strain CBS 135680) TaxID=1388766 RepID=A0A017RYR1_ASPRC|nr:intron endonuclease [Aspergillus ruber CBS 135680]EYE89923.1 intron endonuclease [Aspergillus ruber CBS 135680]
MLFALGFVVLFTIGGLLKNHLALPLKTTVCWELLTIMLLGIFFKFPVTMHNFEQSAGNQRMLTCILVGSSETISSPKIKIIFEDIDNKNLKPVKVYNSLKEDKDQILKDQKGKSGVYYLVNKINGHTYVGSSINLASRMKNYLNNAFLKSKQNSNMPIVKALLKYDQSNFSLLILEYVEPEYLITRETFYITQIIPYYNVLKQGYSSLGYKHTEETKKMLSELAKNRTHSDKTKALIAIALVGQNNPFYEKNHSTESKIRMIEAKSAYPVYVYNSFKELLVIFPSVLTLAKLIKSNHPTLVDVIKEKTIFRECSKLVSEIINQSHIRKAVFVYDENKKFIGKYIGVMDAERTFNINHSIIKKYASVGGAYKGYIFSYERISDTQ